MPRTRELPLQRRHRFSIGPMAVRCSRSTPTSTRRVRFATSPKSRSLARQWRNGLPAILSRDPMALIEVVVAIIWIEPLGHADDRPRYSARGQLYRTRLGGPDGEMLVESTVAPVC